jgi:spermidine synthase
MEINLDPSKFYADKIASHRAFVHSVDGLIYSGKTEYQKVEILKTSGFGRFLILDDDLQSSEFDEFIYHETLVHPAMLIHPHPHSVLILGGGEGATLREVVKYKCLKKVVMVDIDRELVEICKKFLPEWSKGAFDDNRGEQIFDDARHYIRETNDKFDVVICDLTEPFPNSPSQFLLSEEFFGLVKNKMNDRGIFIMQASMASIKDHSLHITFYKTLSSLYSTVRSLGVFLPSFCNRWGFLFCSDYFDPLSISRNYLMNAIYEKLSVPLDFYDYEAHKSVFSLEKPFKSILIKIMNKF